MVHINSDRIWATMDKAPSDHQQLAKMCEYHLVFLGHGCFAELVKCQHPLIVVELTNRDTEILELGVLTCDEEETLNSIIFCGLGFTLGLGEPFVKDIKVKKEPQNSGDCDFDNTEKSVLGTNPGKLSDDGSSMNQNIDNMDMESMSVLGTDPCVVAKTMEKHSDINTSVSVPDTDPDTPCGSHAGTNQEKLDSKQTTYME